MIKLMVMVMVTSKWPHVTFNEGIHLGQECIAQTHMASAAVHLIPLYQLVEVFVCLHILATIFFIKFQMLSKE